MSFDRNNWKTQLKSLQIPILVIGTKADLVDDKQRLKQLTRAGGIGKLSLFTFGGLSFILGIFSRAVRSRRHLHELPWSAELGDRLQRRHQTQSIFRQSNWKEVLLARRGLRERETQVRNTVQRGLAARVRIKLSKNECKCVNGSNLIGENKW